MRKRKRSSIRKGMRADDVLKLRGRSQKDAVGPAQVVGEDENGLIVRWSYADCTVELRRKGDVYRVAGVALV